MKRIISILGFLTLLCFELKSQGFIRPYDFDKPNGAIGSIIYENDTLFTLAVVLNQDTTQWGFLLAKMDTMGNVFHTSEIYPPDDINYYTFSWIPGSFVKLRDNQGFIIIGSRFGNSTVILKLNNNGELLWRRHPSLENSQLDHFYDVVESNKGFIILGKKTRPNFSNDAVLIKYDEDGNVEWENSFGLPDYVDLLTKIDKKSENEIIIYGNTFSRGSWQQNTFTSAVYSFDSLGNENWHLESPRSLEETGMIGLHIDLEGNYNYVSSRWVYNQDGSWNEQPKFFKRDKNFRLLEERFYCELQYNTTLMEMIPVSSGGYLAIGGKIVSKDDPTPMVQADQKAWFLRLDENGDSLWSSEHLVFSDITDFETAQKLNSVVELPSGSFIAAGIYETLLDFKKYGFLIKVDKNGCIDTIPCQPVSSVEEPIKEPIRVFPNPTSQNVTFSFSSPSNKHLIINDLSGNVIAEAVIPSYQTQYVWSSEKHPPGVYFYQVFSERGVIQSGKVVVQR